jgi:hypothetical protein
LRAKGEEKEERRRGEQHEEQGRRRGSVFGTKDENDQGRLPELPVVRRCADRLREG